MANSSGFSLLGTDPGSRARYGQLHTPHGTVATPFFMPVATQATVKTLTAEEVSGLGYEMVLANAYHLYLRPGEELIRERGGLHRFMGWPGATLTDSGGFQIFSLAPLRKLTEEGARFRSHIDGSEHFMTPERAVRVQEALGADVIMCLDVCSKHDDPLEKLREDLELTHHWAGRCLAARENTGQMLFAITQGGVSAELRKHSAQYLAGLDFPGYAIGGLSVGERKDEMWDMVDITTAILPQDKPRYLMGVGSPEDIIEGVYRGIDMFDCALPTRVARNGALFTRQGRRNITNAGFSRMDEPFDELCDCYGCRNFSAAYLHHLFRSGEILGLRLASLHNLRFMSRLMQDIRRAISGGRFGIFRDDFLAGYRPTDEATRISQKQQWLQAKGG